MPQRFGYVEADPLLGAPSALPYAPIMHANELPIDARHHAAR